MKAAVAAAGGEGQPIELPANGAMSDYISAEQRVRQLELDQATLMMRKARLEAQRDDRDNFIMPMLVGIGRRNVDFDRAYSNENDTFFRLAEMYRGQIQTLLNQKPRIEAEVKAVVDQIATQKEHLDIVNSRLRDLESLFAKGYLRKDVLLAQQIEKSLVEGQVARLEAQVARLRQTMGELDVKVGDVKATYLKQTLTELQDASQRLRDIDNTIGPARKLLEVKAQGAGGEVDEPEYLIRISRVRDGQMVTFDATDDTMLAPGDVVEIKLKRNVAETRPRSQRRREASSRLPPSPKARSCLRIDSRLASAANCRAGRLQLAQDPGKGGGHQRARQSACFSASTADHHRDSNPE